MKFEAKRILAAPAAILLVAGAVGICAPAISEAATKPATAVVRASDLNLATADGKRTLEQRTAAAITKVCPLRGVVGGPRSNSLTAYRECSQSVRSSVKLQLTERGARSVAGT